MFIVIRKNKLKKSLFEKSLKFILLHAKPNLQFVYVIEILGKSAMGVKAIQELI